MSIYHLLRRYSWLEAEGDGYPAAWHRCPHCNGSGIDPSDFDTVSTPDGEMRVGADCTWCLGAGSAKNLIRQLAGHRCERCRHPYVVGVTQPSWERAGDSSPLLATALLDGLRGDEETFQARARRADHWSPCDAECTHGGPIRWRIGEGYTWHVVGSSAQGESSALVASRAEVQASWRILTVHHLNGDKLDLRWWNLAALCQRDHLAIQGKVTMDRVWPWEHSPWFRIHAAGWYSVAYEGRDITREEAEARLDDLLALERMA